MIERGEGGKIINIASQIGLVGYYQRSAYCAAKAGVVNLKRGTASMTLRDLTGFNGRCDAIYLTTDPNLQPPAYCAVQMSRRTLSTATRVGCDSSVAIATTFFIPVNRAPIS